MLSLTYLNPKQALAYYGLMTREANAQDAKPKPGQYYTDKAGGFWYGKTARFLSLAGAVQKNHFSNLLQGRTPSGRQLIQAGENNHHRAGYDLTFSAPKSFSILAEILTKDSEQQHLYMAHEQAVEKTLNLIEANYATARQTQGGVTRTVETGNLLFARFTEHTSRSQDPQLHSHVVAFNITRRPDGKFRSIKNEPLHQYKMYWGQYYRNELALQIRKLGFEITRQPKGLFEIKGMPEDIIQTFSRRSADIAVVTGQLRRKYPLANEAKLKEMAALSSRQQKSSFRRDDLKQEWAFRLQANVKHPQKLLHQLKKQRPDKSLNLNHIDLALGILTEEESVVTREQLMHTALKLSLGKKSLPDLKQDLKSSKEVRTLKKDARYTTREIESIEREIVSKCRSYYQVIPGQIQNDIWLKTMPPASLKRLTKDQHNALRFIMNGSTDRVIGIQGDAGTGKTTMLALAAKGHLRLGYDVITLAPTARAADELAQRGLPNAQTIDRFLLSIAKESLKPKLIILDEASMLGSRKFKAVLDQTTVHDKVILVGDMKQKQSISQGGIFSKLQQHRVMKTVRMKENIRQEDDILREAVGQLAEKNISHAFKVLEDENKVYVITDTKQRLNAVADQFLASYAKADTLAIIETNSERKLLNAMIRQQLLKERRLSRRQRILDVAQPKGLRSAEKNLNANYAVGDSLFINERIKDIPAGSKGRITHITRDSNTIEVELKTTNGLRYTQIDLTTSGHKITSYATEERKIAKGDRLVFLKNDSKLGVENGLTGIVLTVSKHRLRVLTSKRKVVTFNPRSYPYFDHGYATTIYKAQGLTTPKVLYIADTRNRIDFNSFYVVTTRAKENLTIFTNNIDQLRDQVQIEQSKTSTLDYSLEGPERSISKEREVE